MSFNLGGRLAFSAVLLEAAWEALLVHHEMSMCLRGSWQRLGLLSPVFVCQSGFSSCPHVPVPGSPPPRGSSSPILTRIFSSFAQLSTGLQCVLQRAINSGATGGGTSCILQLCQGSLIADVRNMAILTLLLAVLTLIGLGRWVDAVSALAKRAVVALTQVIDSFLHLVFVML